MKRYAVICFYGNGTNRAYNAESFSDAIAIEAGVLSAWYSLAINTPVNNLLTGIVIFDNKLHAVIQNDTYERRENNEN